MDTTIDLWTTFENGILKIRPCKDIIFMRYKQTQLDTHINLIPRRNSLI
jgi:hypothetical protein